MKISYGRREFVSSIVGVPLAAKVAFSMQPLSTSAFPIIDTHIHIFDKTRPEGAPYPADVQGGGEPVQGMVALPDRYEAIAASFGVAGAIVVEASPRVEDNQWILDVAKDEPIIVGLVGRIDPADPAFGRHLDRLSRDPLFFGIRQRRLQDGLDDPQYVKNLQRLADADCSLDIDMPREGMIAPEVLVRVLEKVPSLRLVLDHLPSVFFRDRAAQENYLGYLRELAMRPHVYIKLSEVVQKWGGEVATRIYRYQDWLDELWDIFGEDRVMFGSDWPQSETIEFNSYPNVFRVAQAYVRTKGQDAMEKVFWKNSLKPYRWVQRLPSQKQV